MVYDPAAVQVDVSWPGVADISQVETQTDDEHIEHIMNALDTAQLSPSRQVADSTRALPEIIGDRIAPTSPEKISEKAEVSQPFATARTQKEWQ